MRQIDTHARLHSREGIYTVAEDMKDVFRRMTLEAQTEFLADRPLLVEAIAEIKVELREAPRALVLEVFDA